MTLMSTMTLTTLKHTVVPLGPGILFCVLLAKAQHQRIPQATHTDCVPSPTRMWESASPPTSKLTELWCGAAVIKCTSRFASFADFNAEDPIYIFVCMVIVMIFVQMGLVSFTCYVDLVCEVGNLLGEFRVSC